MFFFFFFKHCYTFIWASLVAQLVENPPAVHETWVWSLGWEDPLEEDMANFYSILAWRIPMDRGARWASPWGGRKSDTTEWLSAVHLPLEFSSVCIDEIGLFFFFFWPSVSLPSFYINIILAVWIGEGNGSPLQCSCLENPVDRGAWWAAVYGVAQSQTRLKPLSSSSCMKWVGEFFLFEEIWDTLNHIKIISFATLELLKLGFKEIAFFIPIWKLVY